MKKWLLALSALMVTVAAGAAPNNKELKIGISQEFDTFNPLISSMVASTYIYRMVGRSLVNLDADLKWVPQLATAIPSIEKGTAKFIEDKGIKKIQATWEIIPQAKWGDGKPITCEDFVFAKRVAESPNVSIGDKETFAQVEKIDIDPKNPKKCTFTYNKAKWDFYQLALFWPLPKHLEAPIFDKYAKEKEGYEKNSLFTKQPTNKGLYNGPYVISSVKLGDHVILTPNPAFYGDKPKIEKIIVKIIQNTSTLEANLRSGTVDMIATLGLTLDQGLAFEKKAKAESLPYDVQFTPSITYEHIDLNLDDPILKDLKVRKALLFAINREELVKNIFEGKQPAAIHFSAPKDPWYTNDPAKITTYRFSRRESGKLLDDAGWKINKADGYRYKGGKKLTLQIMTTAGNKSREMVQVYLQEQWKQVGVEVTVKNEPARVFFGDTTRERKYGQMALYAWVASPENVPRSTFHSTSIPTKDNGWSGQNYPGWKSKDADALIEQLEVEFDFEKRKEIAAKLLKLYTDEVPVLPMYYRTDISVIPKNLTGYRMTGHQFPETNEIENWNLEAKNLQ